MAAHPRQTARPIQGEGISRKFPRYAILGSIRNDTRGDSSEVSPWSHGLPGTYRDLGLTRLPPITEVVDISIAQSSGFHGLAALESPLG